ncbi:MAG: hypothetical protein JMDDDDMK_03669 [Acidobacteria bacterium]|nr:hypothetical protein [Acidobacteriota bacterium]
MDFLRSFLTVSFSVSSNNENSALFFIGSASALSFFLFSGRLNPANLAWVADNFLGGLFFLVGCFFDIHFSLNNFLQIKVNVMLRWLCIGDITLTA